MPVCDLMRVVWAEDNQVEVESLCIAPKSLQRLLTLLDNQLCVALEG